MAIYLMNSRVLNRLILSSWVNYNSVVFKTFNNFNICQCQRFFSSNEAKNKGKGFKIYTKTGDGGNSSTFSGERRPKSDIIFEALGATDELSSHLALAREFALESNHNYTEKLLRIQCILQDVSSLIATPNSTAREAHLKRVGISESLSEELEEWIDEYTKNLPPLENFILPGGGKASSVLHIARTVCRRAERKVSILVKNNETDKQALIYLNRLSDFLFTVARYAAKLDNRQENIYIRPNVEKDEKKK